MLSFVLLCSAILWALVLVLSLITAFATHRPEFGEMMIILIEIGVGATMTVLTFLEFLNQP